MNISHKFLTLITALICCSMLLSACAPAEQQQVEPPTEVAAPTEEPVVPVTGPEEIEHQAVPAELPAVDSLAFGDQDTSPYSDKKRSPDGDRFLKDVFERPFNANTMDTYYPYLDIQHVAIFEDADWYYGVVKMKGTDGSGAFSGTYGLELDLELDGRGDLLILASKPAAGDWSVTGVQIWLDGNDDVGNKKIIVSDTPQLGDGYEEMLFDQGQGDDPDAAYSRVLDPDTIQFAFKKSLLAGDDAFLIGAWAGETLNPAWFDLNDHFTHDEAGAADPGFPLFYPIKALEKLDNTCRMPVGAISSGPGTCPDFVPKEVAPQERGAPPPVYTYPGNPG